MERNSRKVTCSECKRIHEQAGTAIKHKNKYYCEECVPQEKKVVEKEYNCHYCKKPLTIDNANQRKEKGKIVYYCKECFAYRNNEAFIRQALTEYIYEKHGYREKGLDGSYIAGQIKILKNMYPHYKEAGMLATLQYYYEVCKNDIHPNPYKLIPYVYEEAKEFYEMKNRIKNESLKLLASEKTETREPIIIKAQEFNPRLKIKEIDLDTI